MTILHDFLYWIRADMQFGNDMISYRDWFGLGMWFLKHASLTHKLRQIHTGLYCSIELNPDCN